MQPEPDPEAERFQRRVMIEGDTKLKGEIAKRLVETCFEMCVKLKNNVEEEASEEELECTKNCVKKYWKTHKIVGLKMREVNNVSAQI